MQSSSSHSVNKQYIFSNNVSTNKRSRSEFETAASNSGYLSYTRIKRTNFESDRSSNALMPVNKEIMNKYQRAGIQNIQNVNRNSVRHDINKIFMHNTEANGQYSGNTSKNNNSEDLKIKYSEEIKRYNINPSNISPIRMSSNHTNLPVLRKSRGDKSSPHTNNISTTNNKTEVQPYGSSINEKLFILTGTVERIIHWSKLLSDHFHHFEVIASVVSLRDGTVSNQKIMLLRDRTGPILQVVYYTMITQIAIEDFYLGKMVRCVGKSIGPNILHAFSIRDASQEEIESLQRLTLISDQAVQFHLKN